MLSYAVSGILKPESEKTGMRKKHLRVYDLAWTFPINALLLILCA